MTKMPNGEGAPLRDTPTAKLVAAAWLTCVAQFVLDQASLFFAGGLVPHVGGFAQATYDGVAKHWSWDNLDVRAVTEAKLFGTDTIVGVSIHNNPTIEDPWNTLPAWGFPYTDTAGSPTPAAAPDRSGGASGAANSFQLFER